MADGVLIGPNLLGRIYDLVDGGGTGPRDGPAPAGGKQVAFVKVTGVAAGGWYPGAVRTHQSPATHLDHAGPVEVKDGNGQPLETNKVYLCLRQGPGPTGTPRFVATKGGGGANGGDPSQENQPGGWKYQTAVVGVACASSGQLAVTTATFKVLV